MKQINMLESPVRQVFFSYLVPSISATLVTSIYILADTMMIGRGVGGSGIAAMNILLPLYNTYFGIGMMCGVGGSVLFGFSRGRGDEKRARSYFTAALCVVLALSAVFLILGRIFFNPLITFMGNTPLLNEYTVPYGTVLTTAAPMFALSSFLQAFVRNDGAPKLAMAGVISGGVTNVILDYVYIFIMKWGMGGAALATATGTTLTVLILASHFFSKDNHLKLEFSDVWRRVPEVLGNGLASFILEVSNGFVMLLFNRQLLAYVGEIINTILAMLGFESINFLADKNWALFIICLLRVWQFGSAMVLFLAALKGVPEDLYEAASIDGATKGRQFLSITIPLISPVIFYNLVTQLVQAFQEFNGPYIITNGGPRNATTLISVIVYNTAFKDYKVGMSSAMAWVMFVIVMVLTVIAFVSQKKWVYYSDDDGRG